MECQQMLDAIKHITDGNFFFQKDSAQVHCVCNTIQLRDMWFSCFRVLPGSADCRSTSYWRWYSKASFDCLLYR